MDTAEHRCKATWPGDENMVRCDRWDGHAGEHRGFDCQDMTYRWSDSHPYDPEPPEDRRMGFDPAGGMELAPEDRRLGQERDEWKDKFRWQAERARDLYHRSWQNAVKQRDEARREARAVRDQMVAEDAERLKMGSELQQARKRIRELEERLAVADEIVRRFMTLSAAIELADA